MPSRRDSKVHSPLADGQIRLLRLKPANDHSAPIECSLFAISPTKSTQYETVSHTWGEPKRDKVIKVNSLDFQISRNLFELLPYLRRRWSDRVLWIDALCINQENHKERPSQVKMMGEIYKGASHVVIFLGKKWDGLNIAIEYLKLAAHQEDAHLNPTLEPHLHINGQNISTPYVERNLTKFFSAEWFFRVWTVQEFVLAERFSFQFETTKIGGSLFLKGFFALRRHISNQCCGPLFVECAYEDIGCLQLFQPRKEDIAESTVVRPGLVSQADQSLYTSPVWGPPDDTSALQCILGESSQVPISV
ncbi:hypothetical protein K456DRAFT_31627 [Colletotrichum gloeosporioides 23]|nr:hypothetical protein K456DRAFT_31627 [Colletotrichum gloeosporioides 23]